MSLFKTFKNLKGPQWLQLGGTALSGVSSHISAGYDQRDAINTAQSLLNTSNLGYMSAEQELEIASRRSQQYGRTINRHLSKQRSSSIARGITGGATYEAIKKMNLRNARAGQADIMFMGGSRSLALREKARSQAEQANVMASSASSKYKASTLLSGIKTGIGITDILFQD